MPTSDAGSDIAPDTQYGDDRDCPWTDWQGEDPGVLEAPDVPWGHLSVMSEPEATTTEPALYDACDQIRERLARIHSSSQEDKKAAAAAKDAAKAAMPRVLEALKIAEEALERASDTEENAQKGLRALDALEHKLYMMPVPYAILEKIPRDADEEYVVNAIRDHFHSKSWTARRRDHV